MPTDTFVLELLEEDRKAYKRHCDDAEYYLEEHGLPVNSSSIHRLACALRDAKIQWDCLQQTGCTLPPAAAKEERKALRQAAATVQAAAKLLSQLPAASEVLQRNSQYPVLFQVKECVEALLQNLQPIEQQAADVLSATPGPGRKGKPYAIDLVLPFVEVWEALAGKTAKFYNRGDKPSRALAFVTDCVQLIDSSIRERTIRDQLQKHRAQLRRSPRKH